jgi:hypothetical protein
MKILFMIPIEFRFVLQQQLFSKSFVQVLLYRIKLSLNNILMLPHITSSRIIINVIQNDIAATTRTDLPLIIIGDRQISTSRVRINSPSSQQPMNTRFIVNILQHISYRPQQRNNSPRGQLFLLREIRDIADSSFLLFYA